MNEPTSLAEERATFAAVAVATVFCWYALPDLVRARGLRAVLKSVLLWVTAGGAALVPAVYPESADLTDRAARSLRRLPPPAPAAVVVGAAAAGVAATVWLEKAVFARGERRRARGVRFAHTRQAAVAALATGAVAVADWPVLATGTRRG